MFLLHILNNVGKLSFYFLTLIRFQEGKRGVEHLICCLILVRLTIHIAPNIAILTITETAIASLNIIDNSLNNTSKEVKS